MKKYEKIEIAAVTPQFIKKIVEKHANVDDIGIKSRTRPFPYYRFIAFALCKKFCHKKVSLSEIGKHFGGTRSRYSTSWSKSILFI